MLHLLRLQHLDSLAYLVNMPQHILLGKLQKIQIVERVGTEREWNNYFATGRRSRSRGLFDILR